MMTMILKENKDYLKLKEALEFLNLTEKNQTLAEEYLDVSKPEDRELLAQAEHQDYSDLDNKAKEILSRYVNYLRNRKKEEEAGRYIRFVMEVGGSTARYALSSAGSAWDLKYLEPFLSPVQVVALRAEFYVWSRYNLEEYWLNQVCDAGRNDPELFYQAKSLCYDEDAANTKMLLSACYLHCVKPLEDTKSSLRVPAPADDTRVEGDPEHIREITDYLERRLIGNIDGLFAASNVPPEEDVKKLQDFVRDAESSWPVPSELRPIYSGRKLHDYRMKFLPVCAFMAVEHSERFVSLIRLAAALDENTVPNASLDACYKVGRGWFNRHVERLEEVLPISDEAYVRWGILRKEANVLMRMAVRAPESIRQLMKKVPVEDFGYLLANVRAANPAFYAEFGQSFWQEYCESAVKEHVHAYKTGQVMAENYLLGKVGIESILPFVNEWREQYIYDNARKVRIRFLKDNGETTFYQRAVVLECLRLDSSYNSYLKDCWVGVPEDAKVEGGGNNRLLDRRQIEGILKILTEEQVPLVYQMDFFATAYEGYQSSGFKLCAEVLAGHKDRWGKEFPVIAKEGLVLTRALAVQVMGNLSEEYKENIFACAADSSKQVRECYVHSILRDHREWEQDVLAMLTSKKGVIRELAVRVLKSWGADAYKEPLTRAMEAEKSKKIKELMQSILLPEGQNMEEPTAQTQEEFIKSILSGGRKRKLSWFLAGGGELPVVHKTNGEEASEDFLAALLISYADLSVPGVSADARKLSEELVPEELARYVAALFACWIKTGAEAKKKWVLYAASIHGGEEIVPVLHAQIQEWPKKSRGAIAAEAVSALAINGGATALLLVDQISRKFKFRQVKDAASRALSYAAEQLGITVAELEDRIVPNLGFDERMEQIFDYGTRTFKVILTPALELEVFDENGKKLKNLPAPGKKDEPEKAKAASDAYKLLKKQLKTVLNNQKLRLEQALLSERLWPTDKWEALFVKNPVMHQFATGLIWGLYEDHVLKDTFRYMEDGSFNTVDEDEYELPESGMIGLVHPIELDKENLAAWKEQLSDYEIVQPIEQIDRPVYKVTEEEAIQTELTRFGGRVINSLSLSGKLLSSGWMRGEILDGGWYYEFSKAQGQIGVVLSFSGCGVGAEGEDVTVYGAAFYHPGKGKMVNGRYELDLYQLGEVPPRYFSETVLELTRVTAAFKEQLSYPECVERI